MKKIFIALKPFNNKVFYRNDIFNSDLQTASLYLIAARKLLAKKDILMNTIDIPIEAPTTKDIYIDVPYPWDIRQWLRIIGNRRKNILFLLEPPLVSPFNYMKIFQYFFDTIYTWNKLLVDNKKFFLYFYPKANYGIKTKSVGFKKKKLVLLMNRNWLPFIPFEILARTKELYRERIKAIEFFDKNYPNDFELWGKGWNKVHKYSINQRLFGYKKYKTYKGEFHSKDKYKILSGFKFSLCFENSEVTGYISEKIFDCFKAKCIPIYKGAPNIGEYIPENCYIDFRKFRDYYELYDYLINMKEDEYNMYILNIQKLMRDKKFLNRWLQKGFARFFLRSLNL